jgi:hypothetical protein
MSGVLQRAQGKTIMFDGSPFNCTSKLEPQWGHSMWNSLMRHNLANMGSCRNKNAFLFYFLRNNFFSHSKSVKNALPLALPYYQH